MCRFFNVSRSGYYDYVKRMDIPAKDLPLAEKIQACQEEVFGTYGYRRVYLWLERQGIHHNPSVRSFTIIGGWSNVTALPFTVTDMLLLFSALHEVQPTASMLDIIHTNTFFLIFIFRSSC